MAEWGKTLLIVNPAAQNGNGEKAGAEAETLLGAHVGKKIAALDVFHTEYPRHALQKAAECSVYDTVIALGGDGVIHEAAGGLMQIPFENRPIFGIIPVGSGNDYARTLNMSKVVSEAVEQILGAQVKPVDVGCCNGEYFVETLSFGLDAAIALDTVERRKHTTKSDTALYFEAGIDQLLHHLDSYHYTVSLDGKTPFEGDMKMFAVQIGVTYGGGFKVTPWAQVDDGIFDLCICDGSISLPRAVYTFAKAKDGKHTKSKLLRFETASTIKLRFDRRPPCQMDGEAHIADEYDISINKQALRVLMNR